MSRRCVVQSILLALCSQIWFTAAESAPAQMYSVVFANSGKLSEAEVSKNFKLMASNLNEDKSLTKEMKDRIEYVQGLLTDTDTAHCNIKYIDQVRKQFELINKPVAGNLKTLFGLVHRNLVQVCSAQYMDIAEKFTRISDSHKTDLQYLRSHYAAFQKHQISDEELMNEIMHQFGMLYGDRPSAQDVMNEWKKGACANVNKIVAKPDMRPFYDFALLNSYLSVDSAEQAPKAVSEWAINVVMCEDLDKWMQKVPAEASKSRFKFW